MPRDPLTPAQLAAIRNTAKNYVGDALADDVVSTVHVAYLAGKVEPRFLLREAKLRAIDLYRSEQARKAREAVAAAGTSEGVSYRDDVGGAASVDIEVDLNTNRGQTTDPTVNQVVRLATPARDRRVRTTRSKTIANPRRNEDATIARLDVERVRALAGPVQWGELEAELNRGRGRPDQVRRRLALGLLEAAGVDLFQPSRRVKKANREGVSEQLSGRRSRSEVTMTETAALETIRSGIVRVLMTVLPLPPEAEPAVRMWAGAIDVGEVIDDLTLAVPLLLLDYALASINRDHGLTEDQALAEYTEIAPTIREDWPKMFSGGAPVDYHTYSIEIGGGAQAKFDVVGQAMDYIEAWLARARA